MPLSPHFLQGSAGEQRLVQDLINEQLKIFGQDIVYLPRQIINKSSILKEVTASKFDDAFRMEAYLLNYEGFEGTGDILTKFGVQTTDAVTFVISKEKYEDTISPKLDDDVEVKSRPQEGDLIYFPLDNTLFEIKYVEAKKPFYQLNKLYVYTLSCEVMDYELDEDIDTSIAEVDQAAVDFGYTIQLSMVSLGADTATATVQMARTASGLSTGFAVGSIDLINDGSGYNAPPSIGISTAPVIGVDATAVAIMTSRTGVPGQAIDRILLTNPGFGYTAPPTVTITSVNANGSGGIATAVLSNDGLSAFTITDAGSQYGTTPTVTIPAATSGALATALVGVATTNRSNVGVLTGLTLDAGGLGYKTAPTITVAAPPVRIGVVTQYTPGTGAGSGFVVGDEVLIRYRDGYTQGIGTDAYLKITSVNGSGGITGSEIKYGGHSYEKSRYYQVDPPGGGSPAIDYFYDSNFLGLSTNTQDTGTTATATASVTAGVVTSLTLTNAGVGYTSAPVITISNNSDNKNPVSGVFEDAIAEAVLNTNGEVAQIRYSNSGAGYTSAPSVTISAPAVGVAQTGDYLFKEMVRGVGSGTTAFVQSWDADDRILKVTNASGTFIEGEKVVGIGTTLRGSDAVYIVRSTTTPDDLFGDNDPFESEADQILDFTERNPFGEF